MNPSIFRQYDIRGVVEQDLTSPVTIKIGRAFGSYIRRRGGKSVIVGGDNRLHTRSLCKRLIGGIRSTGCDVIELGTVPTPALYFADIELDADGSVQVTGSHNPAEFNGFKLSHCHASVFGENIQELKRMIEENDFVNEAQGKYEEKEIMSDYQDMIVGKVKLERPLKVALDAGNATASLIAPRVMRALGCEVVELYCEPDGTFPNHHPDPTVPENLVDLIALVKETKADAGIAYDGDSDRIGVVNEKGEILWGDQLLALYAREILAEGPAPIIFEVKCSTALIEDIRRHGGKPVMWRTGHSLIKKKMKEMNSPLAGEMSGHIFFKHQYYGFDDAIYATARLLRIMAADKRPLSDLLSDLPRYPSTPEIRIDCPDHIKFEAVNRILDQFKQTHQVIDVDGMRVLFEDGSWGLVRASNTQPVLVLRFEAKSEERLQAIKKEIEGKLCQIVDMLR
ncbi:MAG: phosphomannomutase [Candidatus Cloacimonetes bacterium 4572_55]|nr:MAG: phosphomannomutase [Candidatus Cloacimonetes bacterium 4572_55]